MYRRRSGCASASPNCQGSFISGSRPLWAPPIGAHILQCSSAPVGRMRQAGVRCAAAAWCLLGAPDTAARAQGKHRGWCRNLSHGDTSHFRGNVFLCRSAVRRVLGNGGGLSIVRAEPWPLATETIATCPCMCFGTHSAFPENGPDTALGPSPEESRPTTSPAAQRTVRPVEQLRASPLDLGASRALSALRALKDTAEPSGRRWT